ncbi:MAG: hypothetical protein OEZ39_07030 [Gammaproteobacteria bacterium]|nr:hypothetical protein [Gammaproteobacteria bacterium]MDH5651610.1 hypothetical protein [Gammaproteobacteria bacterium]
MQITDTRHICKAVEGEALSLDQALQQIQRLGFSYHTAQMNVIDDDTPDDEIIEACHAQIATLMEEDGYEFMEVIRLKSSPKDHAAYIYKPERDNLEARLITSGHCTLFVRFKGQILEFHCQAGDVIRMPGELCYWIETDLGVCHYVHLYASPDGWDNVTARQDSHPCAMAHLKEAG